MELACVGRHTECLRKDMKGLGQYAECRPEGIRPIENIVNT